LKYKHFINPGTFIAVKGRIAIPYRRKELEFTVNSIEMLQTLREKRASRLDVKVSTKSLDQRMVSDLSKLFESNSGNCLVNFLVYDPLDKIEVNMLSKSIKVDLNNELLKALDAFDLEYRVK